jgi:NAD(P)-dependent dehydrogenase (short-subunit alcohol dehydrogenase family)
MRRTVVDPDHYLADRGAVVVGGSRGIGRAVAQRLAGLGAGVVINGRDADAVAAAASGLSANGSRVLAMAGSASDPEIAATLVDLCITEYGHIDILVNCAGVGEPPHSSILNTTSAEFRELIDVHLHTAFETCRAAAPRMVAQRSGAIVNTSSAAFLGDYGGTGYPAGKGGVNGLTLAMAAELKQHGVRANVVCPGAKTRLSTGSTYEAHVRDLNRRGLLDQMSARAALDAPDPAYAASIYALLASDFASSITGEIFIAAGGFVGRFDRPTPSILTYRDHATSPPWQLDELAQLVTRPAHDGT